MSRPIQVDDENSDGAQGGPGPFGNLSEEEQQRLREENGGGRFGLDDLGDPGEEFTRTNFTSLTQLSFPASEADDVASLGGTSEVAAGLTLSMVQISGTVPENAGQGGGGFAPPGGGGGGPPDNIDFQSTSVTGVDQTNDSLAAITAGQVSEGDYFSQDDSREAVLNVSYAKRSNLDIAIVSIDGGDDATGTDSGNRSEQQFPGGGPAGAVPPSGVDPEALQAFQDCLEEQGVQLPSPEGQAGGPPPGFDRNDPELQAAFSACQDELPDGIGPD